MTAIQAQRLEPTTAIGTLPRNNNQSSKTLHARALSSSTATPHSSPPAGMSTREKLLQIQAKRLQRIENERRTSAEPSSPSSTGTDEKANMKGRIHKSRSAKGTRKKVISPKNSAVSLHRRTRTASEKGLKAAIQNKPHTQSTNNQQEKAQSPKNIALANVLQKVISPKHARSTSMSVAQPPTHEKEENKASQADTQEVAGSAKKTAPVVDRSLDISSGKGHSRAASRIGLASSHHVTVNPKKENGIVKLFRRFSLKGSSKKEYS